MVERQFNRRVRVVRSDNGGEFIGMKSYFATEGILHQTSCVYTPQQNGRVERKHRHILNVSRSLMFQANLPVRFWGECVLTACHLINRTPSNNLNGKTPFEMLHRVAPNYTTLKVFGCLCFARNVLRDKDKFGERSHRGVFMGYPFGHKGWRVWDIEKQEFFVSRDVIFEEKDFPFSSMTKQNTVLEAPTQQEVVTYDDDFVEIRDGKQKLLQDDRGSDRDSDHGIEAEQEMANEQSNEQSNEQISEVEEVVPTRRSQREKTTSTRLDGFILYTTQCSKDPLSLSQLASTSIFGNRAFLAAITAETEPTSFRDAMKDKRWRNAVSNEVGALEGSRTWDITELPPGKKAIGCHWIFTIKYKSTGKVERYKARLVAYGNRQEEGIDYDETFAPVVKMTTMRMFLKISAVKGWEVHQMDVHNAFLHGD
ncbi:unnamed protein product [Microthlaspi erraticum]|uniref:Integrase catalytic domain-containing protein n=1 Tax=Microthlaspi erraticum TaxID=1685480 RepID=A0A6D2JE18_9BRAS|nr:unnamed protein product [Microthlaspi erraticum]